MKERRSLKPTLKIVGVIPARYRSVRFAGKPLTKILNKPLLQWVIEGAKQAQCLSELIVATDDSRIANLAETLRVKVVMTDSEIPTGSDRVWAAVKNVDCDYVINIQGDEPLLTGQVLDTLATAFVDDVKLATLARPIKTLEELHNPGFAKIALNKNSEAMYFSRAPIPFPKDGQLHSPLKHIGLYGFKKNFLEEFCKQSPVEIERTESLEQLRALWMGVPIKVVLTDYESWGVDTPEDVIRVEKLLREKGSS
jgi:3-deoxy-manno-octulosonate cytidylyltransferase (CMP-KDO synthetase)